MIFKKAIFAVAVFFVAFFSAYSKDKVINSYEDLYQKDMVFSCGIGSFSHEYLIKEFPDAKIQFNELESSILDLLRGKVDGFIQDEKILQYSINSRKMTDVRLLYPEHTQEIKIMIGISKCSPIPDFVNKANEFIDSLKKNGTLDKMYNYWIMEGNKDMPELPKVVNPKGILEVGTTGTVPYSSFYNGTTLIGFDIELAKRFAYWLNYDIHFEIYGFRENIKAAEVGAIDCIISDLNWTEERAMKIDFSEPYLTSKIAVMVKVPKEDEDKESEENSIFEIIKNFFSR